MLEVLPWQGQGGPGGSDAVQGPGGKKGGKILSRESLTPADDKHIVLKIKQIKKANTQCGLLVRSLSQGEGTTLISLLPGKKNKLEKKQHQKITPPPFLRVGKNLSERGDSCKHLVEHVLFSIPHKRPCCALSTAGLDTGGGPGKEQRT